MAILTANYRIDVTQPGFPNHQFSLNLRTEVADLNRVEIQCACLAALLQSSVKHALSKGTPWPHQNGKGEHRNHGGLGCGPMPGIWHWFANCNLDRRFIDDEAQARFGKPVACLNQSQARELIRALYE